MLEEGRQVALEADFLHDRFHLAPDARDFSEADVVDLARREVRLGGPERDLRLVEAVAVRELPDAIRAGRLRALRLDGREHRLDAGPDRAFHRGDALVEQALLLRIRDLELFHLAAEVGEQRRILAAVVEWRTRQDRAAVGQHRVERE